MTYNYVTCLAQIATNFNSQYADNPYIYEMPTYTTYDPDIMKYLRQALYYELYGNNNISELQSGPELKIDDAVNSLIEAINTAYFGIENPVFRLTKMALLSKHVIKDKTYELSNICTATMQNGLNMVLQKLNVQDDKQTVYTLNALFSDYLLDIDPDNNYTNDELEHAKSYLDIQKWINHYITKPACIQIPYKLGLVVTDGKNDQTHIFHYPRETDKVEISKMSYMLSLIYQDAQGWTPMNLYKQHVPNDLSTSNDDAFQSLAYAYYVRFNTNLPSGLLEPDYIRDAFYFDVQYQHDLTIEPVVHLELVDEHAVQAFYLKKINSSTDKLFTLQLTSSNILNWFKRQDEIITVGTFNPTDIDDLYSMPNYSPSRIITISDNKNTGSSKDQEINARLVAHSQTFAPINDSNNKFLIGIYRGDTNDNIPWAKMFGLFDLDNSRNTYNDIRQIHRLEGFNAYRLEAATDLDNDLLIIQIISEKHAITYKKYRLSSIIQSMEKNAVTDINDFEPLDVYHVPADKNVIKSFQICI